MLWYLYKVVVQIVAPKIIAFCSSFPIFLSIFGIFRTENFEKDARDAREIRKFRKKMLGMLGKFFTLGDARENFANLKTKNRP